MAPPKPSLASAASDRLAGESEGNDHPEKHQHQCYNRDSDDIVLPDEVVFGRAAEAAPDPITSCTAGGTENNQDPGVETHDPCSLTASIISMPPDVVCSESSQGYTLPRMALRKFMLTDSPPGIMFEFNNLVTSDQIRNMISAVDHQHIVAIEKPRRGQGRMMVEFSSLEHAQAALNHRLEGAVRDDARDKVIQDHLEDISRKVDLKLSQMEDTFALIRKNADIIAKTVEDNLTIDVQQNVPPTVNSQPAIVIPDEYEINRVKKLIIAETEARIEKQHAAVVDELVQKHKDEKNRLQKEKAQATKIYRKTENDMATIKADLEKLKTEHTKEKASLIKDYERKRQRSPSPQTNIRIRAPSVFDTSAAYLATPSPSQQAPLKRPRLSSSSVRVSCGSIKHLPETPTKTRSKPRPRALDLSLSASTPTGACTSGAETNSIDRLASATTPGFPSSCKPYSPGASRQLLGSTRLAAAGSRAPMTPTTPSNLSAFDVLSSSFRDYMSPHSPAIFGMPVTPVSPAVFGMPAISVSPESESTANGKRVEIVFVESDTDDECLVTGEQQQRLQTRSGRPLRKSAQKADLCVKSIVEAFGIVGDE